MERPEGFDNKLAEAELEPANKPERLGESPGEKVEKAERNVFTEFNGRMPGFFKKMEENGLSVEYPRF